MWISRLLRQIIGFASAYVKNLRGAGFDFLRSFSMTKPQISRFYWVNTILCSVALYYLFYQAHTLRQSEPLNEACAQKQSLGVIAIFILSEVASFILLVGAQVEGAINNWLAPQSQKKSMTSRSESARRIHRILWTWLPPALVAAAYLSTVRFDGVAVWCASLDAGEYNVWVHAARLLWALAWPGLVVSFAAVVAVNWVVYRWILDRKALITVAFGFLSYLVAAAVVGPPDVIGAVRLLRQLPNQIDVIFKMLVGS